MTYFVNTDCCIWKTGRGRKVVNNVVNYTFVVVKKVVITTHHQK